MSDKRIQDIVIVGGGTAGHVEPALAVGRYLEKRDPNIELEFIGTKSGVEVELLISIPVADSRILRVFTAIDDM
mgnify:CR=1 FL=1